MLPAHFSCFAQQTKINFSPAAKEKFEIDDWLEVYLVMEEDGTEVNIFALSSSTILSCPGGG